MDEATDDIINVQIPIIRELNMSKELSVENIDVFCEKGVFDTDASRRILQAGKDIGLAINFHGDELHPMNSGEVCQFKAVVILDIGFLVTVKLAIMYAFKISC